MKRKHILWVVSGVIIMIVIISLFIVFNRSEDKHTTTTSSQTSSVKSSHSSHAQDSSVSSTSLSGDKSLTLETSSAETATNSDQDTSDSQVVNIREARIKLYEAGVDSSNLDDATIAQYWQAAKKQQIDFPTYVKNQLNQ